MVKKPREPLSRERVLTAAVALVDREGVQALTMRRLAADLGVEAMSLYHHLRGKDALLDGVVETVVAEIAASSDRLRADSGGDDWRARLRHQFLAARQVMLRHPWAPGLLGSRQTVPPGVYTYYDEIVGVLARGGFSDHLAHRALHAFGSLPFGFAQELFSPASAGDTAEPDAAQASVAAMADALPHLTAMMAAEIHDVADPALGWCDSQTEFEFTLDLLLDGLQRLRD